MLEPRKGVALLGALTLTLTAWTYSDAKNAAPSDEVQKITLTGGAERPNKVVTMGTGTAEFTWDDHGGISYTLYVKDLSSMPTEAHIHGPADANGTGPVLATLELKNASMTGMIASGKIGESVFAHFKRDELKDLFDHGKAYVNVHTKNYPDGEIRGQFKH